jgi:hypothetical protein
VFAKAGVDRRHWEIRRVEALLKWTAEALEEGIEPYAADAQNELVVKMLQVLGPNATTAHVWGPRNILKAILDGLARLAGAARDAGIVAGAEAPAAKCNKGLLASDR